MVDLRNLRIENFHLSDSTTDKLNSIFYDKNDDEDTWFRISPDTADPEGIIVTLTVGAEDIMITAFNSTNIEFLEGWLASATKSIEEL